MDEENDFQMDKLEIITAKRAMNYEGICVKILYVLLFLLPLFALPLSTVPFVFSKSIFFYLGLSLAFIFWLLDKLQSGSLSLPKSILLFSTLFFPVVWFFSSLFSSNSKLSFVGRGYETDTFFFFLLMAITVFLMASLFQTEKRVFLFYLSLFFSGIIVYLVQFFHIVVGFSFGILQKPTNNLIGSWYDLSIFFGFIALVSLVFFDLFKFSKKIRTALIALVLASLSVLITVNFFVGWLIFGFFVLIFLVYLFTKSFFETSFGEKAEWSKGLFKFSFFVLALTLFVVLKSTFVSNAISNIAPQFVEVSPSWAMTFDISKKVLSDNLFLGSGPNTFLYDWIKFKPVSINTFSVVGISFWAVRFFAGAGNIPTMFITSGLIGGLTILFFLIILLSYGVKVLSSYEDDFIRTLTVASFLGSLYFWSFILFYTPGFVINVFAFLSIGLLIGVLSRAGKLKKIDISLMSNPKVGFVSVLFIVFLIIASTSFFYLFTQKAVASYHREKANVFLNEKNDLVNAKEELLRVVKMDAWDEDFRNLAEISLFELKEIVSSGEKDEKLFKMKFTEALSLANKNSEKAKTIMPLDPENWMQYGKFYETIIPFGIGGADNKALEAYKTAMEKSPTDPVPLLASARVKVLVNDLVGARKFLLSAIELKGDFVPAILLLSQIDAQEGNLKEAIERTYQTVLLFPNDLNILFRLGYLYYMNGEFDLSQMAFERIVFLREDYANARYFLGIIYDQNGMRKEAIEQFEKIAKTNPDNDEVQQILETLRDGMKVGGVSSGNGLDVSPVNQ